MAQHRQMTPLARILIGWALLAVILCVAIAVMACVKKNREENPAPGEFVSPSATVQKS